MSDTAGVPPSSLWDVFISHASEDALAVARPLAALLEERGLDVWLDYDQLTLGDSLRARIDHGLANSKFGVVILSKHFLAKDWPQKELNGLAALDSSERKVLLPVWHGVDGAYVARFSPMLADRLGVSTHRGLDEVAAQIVTAVKGRRRDQPAPSAPEPDPAPQETPWHLWPIAGAAALSIAVVLALLWIAYGVPKQPATPDSKSGAPSRSGSDRSGAPTPPPSQPQDASAPPAPTPVGEQARQSKDKDTRPSRVTVAVVEFKNLTGDASYDYLGAGTAEIVSSHLSSQKGLVLIERIQIDEAMKEAKFQYSGKVDPSSAVRLGKLLGAQQLIVGAVQRSAGQLFFTARRVDIESGNVYDSGTARGPLSRLFDLQQQLSEQLAAQLTRSARTSS
jgi:TolB-like protein